MRQFPDHTVIGAFNPMLDPWTGIDFDLDADGRTIDSIDHLREDGVWIPSTGVTIQPNGRRVRLSLEQQIPYNRPLFLDIRWKA